MHATRKLFLAGALALTALVMAASSASAAVTIQQEVNGVDSACPSNPGLNQHVVTGGCHVNFQDLDGIPLLAHTGNVEVPLSNCTVTLEARLATNGAGWATEQVFNDVTPGSCTRRPCDEAAGAMGKLAWPAELTTATSLEATFCLRTAASGEGGAGTNCPVHLPVLTPSAHRYRLGAANTATEFPCEGFASVEITDVELKANPFGEQIEIS